MKLNKEKFLVTEFGGNLVECIMAWDKALEEHFNGDWGTDEYKRASQVSLWCQAQWEVYQAALKFCYGADYHFTRTDDYYGVCTEDESDWLFKRERGCKYEH